MSRFSRVETAMAIGLSSFALGGCASEEQDQPTPDRRVTPTDQFYKEHCPPSEEALRKEREYLDREFGGSKERYYRYLEENHLDSGALLPDDYCDLRESRG